MKRGGLATGLWLGAWAPAALIGVTDVAAHGQGLSFVDAAASVGLWLLLALPVALAAGLGGLLLARLRHSDRLLPRLVGVGFAVAAFAALALDLLDPPAAAGLGIVGVLVAGLTPRSRGMGGAATGPALVAALALWVAIAPLLAGALAPEGPARDGARPRRAGTSAEAATGSPTGGPRHVVLLVLDTQRVDHLGAYGSSPTFDRLAAESVLFERCYAPASWTVPSHASLFTGLYPARTARASTSTAGSTTPSRPWRRGWHVRAIARSGWQRTSTSSSPTCSRASSTSRSWRPA